jgi:hypothetical protein
MDETELIRRYKNRLRIFLIIYYFGEDYFDEANPHLRKILTAEVKIQKVDFLLRNPDYLAFVLLNLAKAGKHDKNEIKEIVKEIFHNGEPVLRKLDMEKLFFGAYEDIDDVIGFLKSIELVEFSSNKSLDLKTTDKRYYITDKAVDKVAQKLPELPALQWYVDRLNLIKKFFGHLTGNELRVMQYKIEEYKTASWGDYIEDIQEKVSQQFFELYGESL